MRRVMVYDGGLLEHFMDYDVPVVIDLVGLEFPSMLGVGLYATEGEAPSGITHVEPKVENVKLPDTDIVRQLYVYDHGDCLDNLCRFELTLDKIKGRLVKGMALNVNGRALKSDKGIYVIEHARLWNINATGVLEKDSSAERQEHGQTHSFDETQSKISETCDSIKAMLLEKNRKYGNSALEPMRVFSSCDAVEQIKVRMDDKLSRIRNQQSDEDEDVWRDLAGYMILLLVAKEDDK